jgi:hypothetical protein
MKIFAYAFVFILAAGAPAAGQSGLAIRCGSDLVSPGYLKYEVLQTCGEPLSREIVGEVELSDGDRIYDRRWKRYEGGGSRIVLYLEEWLYDKSGLHVLRFEGNRLVKVESVRPK